MCVVQERLGLQIRKQDVISCIQNLTLLNADGYYHGKITFEETSWVSKIESAIFTSEQLSRESNPTEAPESLGSS